MGIDRKPAGSYNNTVSGLTIAVTWGPKRSRIERGKGSVVCEPFTGNCENTVVDVLGIHLPVLARRIRTGPNRPEGHNRESAL